MKISVRAPNRIDLAGGTIDIYPLYIFEEGAATVNIAIQIFSQVELETRSDSRIEIVSKDMKKEVVFEHLSDSRPEGELDLLIRAVNHYKPQAGITLISENQAPQGSGIGASSALLMAASAALNELTESHLSFPEMINIGANLEAQTIKIPTGKQDYYAAFYGGINAVWFDVSGARLEPISYLEKEIQELESRVVLSYTGIPHFSGENNWTIMKRYIDGEPKTISALKEIKKTALKMREAVINKKWNRIGELLKEEWENRKQLTPGVTTEKIDQVILQAEKAGAAASKLCGAGGGGCMITWVEPDKKKNVELALSAHGLKLLQFKVSLKGIQKEISLPTF
jgi:D-glycero-alpha-D-manno-heptose-7-phosphate kinase